jgi:hypothetical protein
MLEKLICPQCGGNELKPFGSAFKCEACGTILKDEPEPQPEHTHYVAPVSSFDDDNRFYNRDRNRDDNDDADYTKRIFGGVIGALAFVVIICLKACPHEQSTPDTNFTYNPPIIDTSIYSPTGILNSLMNDSTNRIKLDPDAPASYQENGITVQSVDLIHAGTIHNKSFLNLGWQMKVSLKKPVGFTKEKNKVFVGISFLIKDHTGAGIYLEEDLNKTLDDSGEDYHHYSKTCDIPFEISDAFHFSEAGNYFFEYRVWDKKSEHEISGTIPMHVLIVNTASN